jgi:hypothetical protein
VKLNKWRVAAVGIVMLLPSMLAYLGTAQADSPAPAYPNVVQVTKPVVLTGTEARREIQVITVDGQRCVLYTFPAASNEVGDPFATGSISCDWSAG